MTTQENTPITYGFEPCDLSHLSLDDQTTVAVLLARVYEQGRRFGAGNALLHVADGDFEDADEMLAFLYEDRNRSFDSVAPFHPDGLETLIRQPALEQLFVRFPELEPLLRRVVGITVDGWSVAAATNFEKHADE